MPTYDRELTVEEQQGTYECIMHGCTRRERRAQAAFYDLFAPGIHATAYRMLDSAEEAEEVVQEVLLKTLTNTVLLLPDHGGMARRLRRMAVNECIDRLRKRHVTWEELDRQTEVYDAQDLDGLLQEQEEENVWLRQAIEALPRQSRTVLQLVVLEEMDYEDVASALHITQSCVRAYLARAKQKLANSFRHERRQG